MPESNRPIFAKAGIPWLSQWIPAPHALISACHHHRRHAVLGTILFGLFSSAGSDPGAQASEQAAAVSPITRGAVANAVGSTVSLQGGQAHRYTIPLRTGDYLELRVDQLGVDVTLTVIAPDGRDVLEIDGPGGDRRPEILRFIAPATGTFVIAVRPTDVKADPGQYRMRLSQRTATEMDRRRVDAHARYSTAVATYFERTPDSLRKAIPLFQSLADTWQQTGDHDLRAVALQLVGTAYQQINDRPAARDYLTRSLDPLRETGNLVDYATSLNYLGGLAQADGDIQRALELYYQALEVFRKVGSNVDKAAGLNNVGLMFFRLGEEDRAFDYFREALPYIEAVNVPRASAFVLSNLGDMYNRRGDYAHAQEVLNKAMALRGTGIDTRGEARILNAMATTLLGTKQFDEARTRAEESASLFAKAEDVSGEGTALTTLGDIRAREASWSLAERAYDDALGRFERVGDILGELGVHQRAAQMLRDRHRLSDARHRAEQGVAVAERLQAFVVSPELRSTYLSALQGIYDVQIDVLMQLAKEVTDPTLEAAALQASEHASARTLYESLGDAQSGVRQGIPPALLARQTALTDDVRKAAALAAKAGPAAVEARRDLDRLYAELDLLRGDIRRTSSGYASLYGSLEAAQLMKLMDEGTVAIKFHLATPRSWAWVVTPTAIHGVPLPDRQVVEPVARALLAHFTAKRMGTPREAAELSRLVLAPLSSRIEAKRLVVVPSGALHGVPWIILPGLTPGARDATRLIDQVEVHELPSLSTIGAIRQVVADRERPTRKIAVIADPVYNLRDSRFNGGVRREAQHDTAGAVTGVSRAMADSGLGEGAALNRLVNTGIEANSIRQAAPGQAEIARGFAATRAYVMSGALEPFAIVHFATHAFANGVHPNLSGLALAMTNRRRESIDGFVRLLDVYNLKLRADLVVLSACDTALGRTLLGEGVIGLTRGFMHAGAARVVSTRWKVDDRATAELIKRFYRNLQGRSPMTPGAALHAAQLSISREPQWKDPYYWAGFTIQGEWR